MGVVPSAAAHQVAAVGLLPRRLVAQAALRPGAARQRVGLAVVGRALQVHQLRVQRLAVRVQLLDLQEGGPLGAAGSHGLHVHRLVVLVLEDVAQLAELGQRGPAGLGGAGARHAVALALQAHALLQDLRDSRGEQSRSELRVTLLELRSYLASM